MASSPIVDFHTAAGVRAAAGVYCCIFQQFIFISVFQCDFQHSTINADNSYVAAVRVLGNQQATSVTLNTSGYNGSYYVLMGFSNNNSRSFTGYIYSLKCNF